MILTAPLYLIALVATGIPIAIHLLQLRRYRKVYFSNVDALQELHDDNRRQHRLRQWIVLAMRIVAIVGIVLAFCRPVIPGDSRQHHAGGTAVSVYLDNSYSMECGGMDGSLMESAKQKAREIAAAYRPDDRYQLLTGDAEGSQFRWLSRDEFLAAVDQVQTSAAAPQLSSVARRQQEFLHQSSAANRHAYLIGDFQRTTADLADFPTDSTTLTTFVPLGGTAVDNLYIDTLAFDSPAYCLGATATATVVLRNNGNHEVEGIPVRLFVNGRQRAMTAVTLPAGGSATVPLHFSIDQTGLLQGHVETVDYPVTFDDRLYFTLNIAERIPLLLIGGNGENENLRRLFDHDSLTVYHYMPANHIDYTHLTDHNVIILDEMAELPSGLAQTLQQYATEGGTLVVIPPEHATAESYNTLLGALQAPQLAAWHKGALTVQQLNSQCTLYHGVFDGEAGEMEMPTVQGVFTTTSTPRTLREGVLTLADGSDMLAVTPAGKGRLYLFGTPLRKEYTDFVQQALFVPTVYNMALFSTAHQEPYHLIGTADAIALTGHYEATAPPHLRNSDSTARQAVDLIPDVRRVGNHYMLIPHAEVQQAGNYRLTAPSASPKGTDEGLSLNYRRAESDLTVYSAAELRQLLHDDHLAYCSLVGNAGKSLTEHIRQRSQGTPLWRYCLLLTLLALAAETLLLRLKPRPAQQRKTTNTSH